MGRWSELVQTLMLGAAAEAGFEIEMRRVDRVQCTNNCGAPDVFANTASLPSPAGA
jgi:hypothetical protein